MNELNLGEIAKDQVKTVKRKKKEEKAKEILKKKKSTMAKLLFRLLVVITILVGIYIFFDNYKFRTPVTVKITLQSLIVKRETYVPIAYTDDVLLVNEANADSRLSKVVSNSPDPKIASIILGYFGFNAVGEDFVAIFTAESGLNPKAMNWNCEYQENGRLVSRACNKEDRERAWSVDCGVAQLNFAGTICPEQAFDPMWNLRMARLKYDRQGKEAWVASWDDNYKKFLVRAD